MLLGGYGSCRGGTRWRLGHAIEEIRQEEEVKHNKKGQEWASVGDKEEQEGEEGKIEGR